MEPGVLQITIRVDGRAAKKEGGDSAGAASAAGFELSTTSKQRSVQVRKADFRQRFPGLYSRWQKQLQAGDCQISLKLPSSLLADSLAEALTAPATYNLRPQNQFTYLTVAHMLRHEARLLQTERYIAKNISTGTVLHALELAAKYNRPELGKLCLQWLRRTGGITPGYLLSHPGMQVKVNYKTGELLQRTAQSGISGSIKDNTYMRMSLSLLLPLVLQERRLKRPFYSPPVWRREGGQTAAAEEGGEEMVIGIAGKAGAAEGGAGAATARGAGAADRAVDDATLVLAALKADSDASKTKAKNAKAAAAAAAASKLAEPLSLEESLFADVSNSNMEADSNSSAALATTAGGSGSPASGSLLQGLQALSEVAKSAPVTVIEAGSVFPELLSLASPAASSSTAGAKDASADSSSSSFSSTTSTSSGPLHSGPGVGFPGMVRCYVVRRRDGNGPCRCLGSGIIHNISSGVSSIAEALTGDTYEEGNSWEASQFNSRVTRQEAAKRRANSAAGSGSSGAAADGSSAEGKAADSAASTPGGSATASSFVLSAQDLSEEGEWAGIVQAKLGADGDESKLALPLPVTSTGIAGGAEMLDRRSAELLPWLATVPGASRTGAAVATASAAASVASSADAPVTASAPSGSAAGAGAGALSSSVPLDASAGGLSAPFSAVSLATPAAAVSAAAGDLSSAAAHACVSLQRSTKYDDDEGLCPLHNGRKPYHSSARAKAEKEKKEEREKQRKASGPAGLASSSSSSSSSAAGDVETEIAAAAAKLRPEGAHPLLCSCTSRAWSGQSRHIFELRRESDDSLIMAAACTADGGRFIFSRSNNLLHLSPKGGDCESYLGCTSINLLGTCITLYDWGMAVDPHAADSTGMGTAGPLLGHPLGPLPELGRREIVRINYDTNILASAPNKMTVELRDHSAYDRINARNRASHPAYAGGAVEAGIAAGAGASASAESTPSSRLADLLSKVVVDGIPADALPRTSEGGTLTGGAAGGDSGPVSATAVLLSAQSGSSRRGPTPIATPDIPTAGDFRNLRVCTPSNGFALGLGSSQGVGSWTGLLTQAWNKLVGAEVPSAALTILGNRVGGAEEEGAASAAGEGDISVDITIPVSALLATRKPRWNDKMEAWTMDFKGRVIKASKKNFQLVAVPLAFASDPSTYTAESSSTPALLFGKVEKDRYSLDFAAPLGPTQAFAIALTTFASKLAVA